jgi:hypothetical protein
MNNHIKFKIQNPTHLTTPLEIQCGFILVSWMLLGFCKTRTHKKSLASLVEENKHTKVV